MTLISDQQDLEKFKHLYSVEAMALPLDDVGAWEGKGQPAKGLGKGKGKGKALGKGKGKKWPLAILDGSVHEEEQEEKPEQTEEEALKEALKKARKARDAVASVQSDLDDALGKAKASLSRQGKATAEGLIANMSKLGVLCTGWKAIDWRVLCTSVVCHGRPCEFYSNTLKLPHWAAHHPCWECNAQNWAGCDASLNYKEICLEKQKFVVGTHAEHLADPWSSHEIFQLPHVSSKNVRGDPRHILFCKGSTVMSLVASCIMHATMKALERCLSKSLGKGLLCSSLKSKSSIESKAWSIA